jgi:hypothetical protein
VPSAWLEATCSRTWEPVCITRFQDCADEVRVHVTEPVEYGVPAAGSVAEKRYRSPGTPWQLNISRAVGFLRGQIGADGLPSAAASFDEDFRQPFGISSVRAAVLSGFGIDVGFDCSAEAFSAMHALGLLAPVRDLAGDQTGALARQVALSRWGYRYRFFPDVCEFAADTDCTSVAVWGLVQHGLLTRAQQDMFARELALATADRPSSPAGAHGGVMLVYWDDGAEARAPARGRKHDPVVCANALSALHQIWGHDDDVMAATVEYLALAAGSGRCLAGTRYYPSADALLHAASRLCALCGTCAGQLARPLRAAVEHRHALSLGGSGGPGGDSLGLALRTLAAENLAMHSGQESRRSLLAARQRQDGSWPAAAYYRMGRVPLYFGSEHLTTLFALRALIPGPETRPAAPVTQLLPEGSRA